MALSPRQFNSFKKLTKSSMQVTAEISKEEPQEMLRKKAEYSEEFKKKAIELINSTNHALDSAEKKLGVKKHTLSDWVYRDKIAKAKLLETNPSKDLSARELVQENTNLKLELERVKKERDILKKAVEYFEE